MQTPLFSHIPIKVQSPETTILPGLDVTFASRRPRSLVKARRNTLPRFRKVFFAPLGPLSFSPQI